MKIPCQNKKLNRGFSSVSNDVIPKSKHPDGPLIEMTQFFTMRSKYERLVDLHFIYYLCTKYQYFHIFLCLKFYFSSPFFPVDLFHVVNSLLCHSNCYFLHPQISRPSLPSSFKWTPSIFFIDFAHSFVARNHTS